MQDLTRLNETIEALKKQRPLLGDTAVDTAIAALVKEISDLEQSQISQTGKESERKMVTVMFADLSGFTALSENTDPEIVRKIINSIFERLAQVIIKYGGFIEKYIGDEIMSMFGAPLSYEDHAERALRAALQMMEEMDDYNKEHSTNLDLHIGINTGLVVTGMIGSQANQQYGVTGDTVNLAARLKHAAQRKQIFVGVETYRLTRRFFEFETLSPLEMKGKSEKQEIYQVLRPKIDRVNPWGERISSPLIGRKKEMSILQKSVQNLLDGKGGILAITGEAGIGKSRLMAELKKELANNIRWVEGRSLSYSREIGFGPAIEILKKLLKVKPQHNPEQIKNQLRQYLETNSEINLSEILPYLAHLMKLPLTLEEEDRIKYLPTPALNKKIHTAFKQFCVAQATKAPVVMVWEDLHWADPASLRLIESLLDIHKEIPLMMVLVFRPIKEEGIWDLHTTASTDYNEKYQVLHLKALTSELSSQLAKNITETKVLAPEIAEFIFSRTEGNPFYVEELVRALLDQEVLLVEGNDIKSAKNLQEINLPLTLQGIIAARIDQLPAEDKVVLQTASILGRIFQKDILDQLMHVSSPFVEIESSIVELIRHEFLRRKKSANTNALEFVFKHAFTHEVAYESLLIAKRDKLHQQAGEIYVALAGDSPQELATTIAYHYERTQKKDKALHFLEMAANYARKNHINEEAINLYSRAIAQIEWLEKNGGAEEHHMQKHTALLENLADMQELNGQHQDAISSFKKALKSNSGIEFLDKARLYRKLGGSCNSARLVEKSSIQFNRAEKILLENKEPEKSQWWNEWFALQLDIMFLLYWRGKNKEMKELLERTFPEIETHGTKAHRVRFYQNLVMAELFGQKFRIDDRAMNYASTMMSLTEELDDLRTHILSLFLYGFALYAHMDLEECIEAFNKSIKYADKLGDVINKARCLNFCMHAYRRLGNVEKTREYNDHTLKLATALNLMEYIGHANADLAWLAWKEGNEDAILKHGTLSVQLLADFTKKVGAEMPFYWLPGFPLLAVYHKKNDWSKCVEWAEKLSSPSQTPLEPELQILMKKVSQDFKENKIVQLEKTITEILELGEKFKYL